MDRFRSLRVRIVTHRNPGPRPVAVANTSDGHHVPVPHLGVVPTMADREALADRVPDAGIAPHVRFRGQVGEEAAMVFRDPRGNALAFEAFADDSRLFAH